MPTAPAGVRESEPRQLPERGMIERQTEQKGKNTYCRTQEQAKECDNL